MLQGLGRAARAFPFSFGDGAEAQGIVHTKFLRSALLPVPKGGDSEPLIARPVARILSLPTNLSMRSDASQVGRPFDVTLHCLLMLGKTQHRERWARILRVSAVGVGTACGRVDEGHK